MVKKIKKEAKKIVPKVVVKAPKKQKLIASRNVYIMKNRGWKEVKLEKDKHNRVLGVNTNVSDLVLMEK